MSETFARLFNFSDGSQLLVIKDPKNKGITYTTRVGIAFRYVNKPFDEASEAIDLFESLTKENAELIRKSMVTKNKVDFSEIK